MAGMFTDPGYVFPVDGTGTHTRGGAMSSPTQTPGQSSMTGVFAGPPSPYLCAAVTSIASTGLDAAASRDRMATRSPCGEDLISVITREGDELHYPVVHGRAGGSIANQSGGPEASASGTAARGDVAARAHRHASCISASASSHTGAAGDGEEDETPAEMTETYQHSRATPSSIQRHRVGSRTCSRSPPPSLALRGEPVEDTVRATSSAAGSMCSSLTTTPRQSIRRTPESTPLCEVGGADRRSQAVVDGVSVRVEETGVSTPEMAEYFADGATDAAIRLSGNLGHNPCASASSSLPSRRALATPRHSQQFGTAAAVPHHPQADSTSAFLRGHHPSSMLDRLMHLMEEQSKVSQQLLSRMDALEHTNRTLVDRLDRLETTVEAAHAREEVVARVSAASASPSVTRTSGSMDSAARPSTRAPSKAVN